MLSKDEHKAHINDLLISQVYGGPILNNSHRGDIVEMMVWDALGTDWEFVGLGWHPWDLQRGTGPGRVRIQVKQCALLQLWGRTKIPTFQFSWSKNSPEYFQRDNPNESIESEGYFCELFIQGLHLVDDSEADQRDVNQWQFSVVPVSELSEKRSSMVLHKALEKWPPVSFDTLRAKVDDILSKYY